MDLARTPSPVHITPSGNSVDHQRSPDKSMTSSDSNPRPYDSKQPKPTLDLRQNPSCNLPAGAEHSTQMDCDLAKLPSGQSVTKSGSGDVSKDRQLIDEVDLIEISKTQKPESAPSIPSTSNTLKKYAPTSQIPCFHGQQNVSLATLPPGMDLLCSQITSQAPPKRYGRFSRKDFLPPTTAPPHVHLEEMAYRWAVWVAKIDDPTRRQEVIKWIAEKVEIVAREYCKGHVCCRNCEPDTRRTTCDGGAPTQKSKPKRATSPSRQPLLAYKDKGNEHYAITYGEIEEEELSLEKIKRRTASKDLDPDGTLMKAFLYDIGRGEISRKDWQTAGVKSNYNSTGRDLFIFCLYEVQQAQKEIDRFERLMRHFTQAIQKKNTFKRIEEQQERQDLCLAIALELNEKHAFVKELTQESDADATPQVFENSQITSHTDESDTAKPDTAEEIDQTNVDTMDHEKPASTVRQVSGDVFGADAKATDPAILHTAEEPYPIAENNVESRKRSLTSFEDESENSDPPIHGAKRMRLEAVEENDAMKVPTSSDMGSKPQDHQMQQDQKRATVLHHRFPHINQDSRSTIDAGYRSIPTIHEVEQAIPYDGLTPPQLSDTFIRRIDQTSAYWQTLVQSVAYYDRNAQRWYRKDSSSFDNTTNQPPLPLLREDSNQNRFGTATITSSRPHLIVMLKTEPGFRPEDFSSNIVMSHKGFRYRYLSSSTLAQRKSMDEHINTFVLKRTRPTKANRDTCRHRYGTYERLCHPEDPGRTTIVHGVWDNKDNSIVEGAKWFYEGRDRPADAKECHKPTITLKVRKLVLSDDEEQDLPVPSAKVGSSGQSSTSKNSTQRRLIQLKLNEPYLHRKSTDRSNSPQTRSLFKTTSSRTKEAGKGDTSQGQTTRPRRAAATRKLQDPLGEAIGRGSDSEYEPSD